MPCIPFLCLFFQWAAEFAFGEFVDSGGIPDSVAMNLFKDREFLLEKRSIPRTAPLPLHIGVHIAIESITDITNIDTTIDLYMTQTWNDGKLREDDLKISGEDISNYSWTPDIYFILAKDVVYDSIAQSLYFEPNANVLYDQKIRVTAPCDPDIWYFPFDNTTCRIILASYGFPEQYLNLSWDSGAGVEFPVQYDELSELGYRILDLDTMKYTASYGTSNFTILEAKVALLRISSIYIYQVYVPAASLVLVSWVTFWINGDKTGTPARASVGVMTVLSMLTICRGQNELVASSNSNGRESGAPSRPTSSPSSMVSREPSLLDVYIWASFSFVIAAMIEFALSDFFRDPNFGTPSFSPLHVPKYRNTNQKIDKFARVMFPVTFAVFNAVYWGYVLQHTLKFKDISFS